MVRRPRPSGNQGEETLLENVLAHYKDNLDLELGIQDNLARSMARSAALRRGQLLGAAKCRT